MGTKIKNVVDVAFSIQNVPKGGDSWSIPLVFGTINNNTARVTDITSTDDLADMGITLVSHPAIYKSIVGMLGQESKGGRSVSLIKLGNKLENDNCEQSVVFDADATAGTFTLTLGAETTAGIAYDSNAAAVKAALEALDAVSEVTVTLNAGGTKAGDKEGFTVEFTGADANTDFATMTADVSSLTSVTTGTVTKVMTGGAVETWLEAYTNIKASDESFKFVFPALVESGTSGTITELVALQAQIETEPRLGCYCVNDANTKGADAGSDSLAKKLFTLAYNSFVLYSNDTDANGMACQLGATLPDRIYKINPAYYPLSGVVADTLTSSEIGYIVAKNCNRIENVGGYTLMPAVDLVADNGGNKGGVLSSGQYLDSVVAKYYLEEKVSEAVYQLLIDNKKVPFTLTGFEMIRSRIYNTMVEYGDGIVDLSTIVITMPDFETYSSTKKGQRWLDGVEGTGTLAGAINKIRISYSLTI